MKIIGVELRYVDLMRGGKREIAMFALEQLCPPQPPAAQHGIEITLHTSLGDQTFTAVFMEPSDGDRLGAFFDRHGVKGSRE